MNSATQSVGRASVSPPVPRDTRRGVAGGIAQFLALLAAIAMLGLWAGWVATHEVPVPAGGSTIENVAPGGLGPHHIDPGTGALPVVFS